MKNINNVAIEFDLEDEGQFYESSLPRLFFPELDQVMTFTPKQIHFHMGNGTSYDPQHGSEHALDGQRFDLEMHIVSLNNDDKT